MEAGRSKDILQSKENLYKKILEQAGASSSRITDICDNKQTLERTLSLLERKGLQETELYRDLKNHLGLEERRADNYVMATEGLTEEQLTEQKKQ